MVESPELDEEIHDCLLRPMYCPRTDISSMTAHVFVYDALSNDAEINGNRSAINVESVLLSFRSPSPQYEVTAQIEYDHSNHHHGS
jgi:hypothetical protein